ncbi:hypothetical protein HG826_02000 [Streptomyces sp. GMY01]|uniref:DUF6801 domain-containing protein n=1 Tax=Streptomyces sp. GMY02 TaxID=1333528 RepID=UPI00146EEF55|nr:hypothetical protein [Streptomyces sp. GMY02]
MKGPRATPRRRPRVRVRTATTAAFVVLAAMVPAAIATADAQRVDASLPYVCAFPSGPRQAAVRVSAVVPDRVAPRQAIRPTHVTTTVELPAEAVADLKAPQAAQVQAATRLAVGVAQNDASAEATWRGTAPPAALPESGPLTLTATGDVPSVTALGAGDLTLTAGNLAVDLAVTSPDGADTPAPLTVACTLDDEKAPGHGLLATVPVGAGASGPSRTPSGSAAPSPSSSPASPGQTPSARTAGPRTQRPPEVAVQSPGSPAAGDAPTCRYDTSHPADEMSLNGYITGYANVRKQKAAALLPPSCALIEQGQPDFQFPTGDGPAVIAQHSEGQLSYQGRRQTAPFKATFLTFDFVPATATMVLEQTGPLTIDSLGHMDMTTFYTTMDTYIRVPLVLKVTSLTVNGTPLDVGSSCRTSAPLSSPDPEAASHPGDHLVLRGRGEYAAGEPATGYILLSGGPLTGEATIPAFTGCTSGGENLDRLLTASVSGPGNYIKQIQGQTCGVANPVEGQCTEDLQPAQIPVPER